MGFVVSSTYTYHTPSGYIFRLRIRYYRKCGVTESGKNFHSFRHTVATIWKRQEVHESIPATLLGHSAGGITYTRYGKGYEVDKLSEVIQLIDYPGLNLQPWGVIS